MMQICRFFLMRIRMHILDANIRMHLLMMMMIASFVFFYSADYHTCNLVPLLQLSMDVVCMCGFV